ncbi:MAG: hypothetical protein M1833_001749 [Piccolia ochrophora]|nr:MAG: hypothetical protein M1833_001749 [Piccolia ochrophora]
MGDDRVDDAPALSSHALGALKDFYSERDARKQQFEDLKANVELEGPNRSLSMDAFAEDWNASQFWYDEETATRFARQLLAGSTNDTHIAIISAPSVFVQLKKISVKNAPGDAIPAPHNMDRHHSD